MLWLSSTIAYYFRKLLGFPPTLDDLVRLDTLLHPNDATTLDIPGYRQRDSYSCGFVAGFMVLRYFKPRASGMLFNKKCNTNPITGTSQTRLIRALRSSKISVNSRKNLTFKDISAYIERGSPVIVTIKLSSMPGTDHWVVIYGIGKNPKRVYLAGGYQKEYTWGDFVNNWYGKGDGLVCSMKRRPK